MLVEDTAHYAGLLLAPAEGFDLWPRAFLALWAKKDLILLCWPILGHLWCPVVTLVTFSSNLSNFKKNPKVGFPSEKNSSATIFFERIITPQCSSVSTCLGWRWLLFTHFNTALSFFTYILV